MTASAGTLTLTEFLTARLDEESQHADYLASIWPRDREDMTLLHWHTVSPAQWRAEVEAKRRLLELHAPNGRECWWCGGDQGGTYPCENLRILASVYASHPDYRSEWGL